MRLRGSYDLAPERLQREREQCNSPETALEVGPEREPTAASIEPGSDPPPEMYTLSGSVPAEVLKASRVRSLRDRSGQCRAAAILRHEIRHRPIPSLSVTTV